MKTEASGAPVCDLSIVEFSGTYRWLSNFYPCRVLLDGHEYPSIENAYQAAKTEGDRNAFKNCTPNEAKQLGQSVPLRKNWNSERKSVMFKLLDQKFSRGTELAEKLVATGDRKIVEGNDWGDTFWGTCDGEGENYLGRMIMVMRFFLNRKNIFTDTLYEEQPID